jgi:hypothetical protein
LRRVQCGHRSPPRDPEIDTFFFTGAATKPQHPFTQAILEEANEQINHEYSTIHKIKGWISNKVSGAQRTAFGGSTDIQSRAKEFGKNVLSAAPQLLGTVAGKIPIPIVSSAASVIAKQGGDLIAKKVIEGIDKDRRLELHAKQFKGTLTPAEMTELVKKEGDVAMSPHVIGKLHDAVRKVDQAYIAAKAAIETAKACEAIYQAAKKHSYLSYRVVRLNFYLQTIRVHIDEIQEIADRYSSQVIGYQYDLSDMMDTWFESTGLSYHMEHCKGGKKEHCYPQLDAKK